MPERDLGGCNRQRERGIHGEQAIKGCSGKDAAKCRVKVGISRGWSSPSASRIIRATFVRHRVDTVHVDSAEEFVQGWSSAQGCNKVLYVCMILRQFSCTVSVT